MGLGLVALSNLDPISSFMHSLNNSNGTIGIVWLLVFLLDLATLRRLGH